MQNDANTIHHNITMSDCTSLTVSGVKDVISFDEMTVILVTTCGQLTIEGEGLHIAGLDLGRGITEITGQITGFYYAKIKEKGSGFFKRGR